MRSRASSRFLVASIIVYTVALVPSAGIAEPGDPTVVDGDPTCPDGTSLVWEYPPGSDPPPGSKPVPGGVMVPKAGCIKLSEVRTPAVPPNTPPLFPDPVVPPDPPPPTPTSPPAPPTLPPTHPHGDAPLTQPSGNTCRDGTGYDFENFIENVSETDTRGYADFQGWIGDGVFAVADEHRRSAPVYGNAVPIDRIRPPGWSWDMFVLGGDYWRFSQDINYHGSFWIGSFDRRYSWRQHPGEWRDNWGETAIGSLTSRSCVLETGYISFKLGGVRTSSQRVELLVRGGDPSQYVGIRFNGGLGDAVGFWTQGVSLPVTAPAYPPLSSGPWVVVRASTADDVLNSDYMQTHVWDVRPFIGRQVKLRIVDDHDDECDVQYNGECWFPRPAHINADEFRFRSAPPASTIWHLHNDGLCGGIPGTDQCSPDGHVEEKPPIWGVTDAHAHPMMNVSHGGHAFWGDPADDLETVYDCRRPLGPIPFPGGRDAVTDPTYRMSCYLHGSIVTMATGAALEGCVAAGSFLGPFAGPVTALCAAVVALSAAVLMDTPIVQGQTFHGGLKITSGAAKFGGMLSESFLKILPDIDTHFSPGMVPEMDSTSTAPPGDPWWPSDKKWHSTSGLYESHNMYQVDMIRRAHAGGMRLAVWDVANARVLALIADGRTDTSDWEALQLGTDAAKRIVGGPLAGIARIAYTPDEAEAIVREGKLAVILGSEVDELGRARPDGLAWPRSPSSMPDTMQKQVDDLWALGIRKISPVHAVNNPIGGTALFNTTYDSLNYFDNNSQAETPAFLTPPAVPVTLDASFGSLFVGLALGDFELLHTPIDPKPQPWNPTLWFDFDLTTPPDDLVGDTDLATYRIGIENPKEKKLRVGSSWKAPRDVLDKQIIVPYMARGAALLLNGCSLENTVIPEKPESFGAAIDLNYQSVAGHRNALGLYRAGGVEDGEAFLRAALRKGMLIDVDHMSQRSRNDVYRLMRAYAGEAGWAACDEGGADCGDYPVVGVHSKLRGLEIADSDIEEVRNAYGYAAEDTRTERELDRVTRNGGVFSMFFSGNMMVPPNTKVGVVPGQCTKDSDCAGYAGPGVWATCAAGASGPKRCTGYMPDSMAGRDYELPNEVANDCDKSSKTLATKYLYMMKRTHGRGLVPSTDLNGFAGIVHPRYGRAMPHRPVCGGAVRDNTDLAAGLRADKKPGWQRVMADAQENEFSGVWYADYDYASPVAAAPSTWPASDSPRFKRVVARGMYEQREDRIPRAAVDDQVFYNNFGPDNQPMLGPAYQKGNRPGAQMYPMSRWELGPGVEPGRRGWDYNLDGLQHIGLYPDLFQDMRNVGVQWEQMGPLFHSANEYLGTWRRALRIASSHP